VIDMLQFSTDQWIIVGLVFLLGLFIGGFIFTGGGRKWKHRFRNEQERREQLELNLAEREKEWRERDSLREAAIKDRDRPIAEARADDPVP
jgi:C4-dicarboxylate-specific signal transduction histidine kinase